jgi:uncharacterized coiled-coil protein SlyX
VSSREERARQKAEELRQQVRRDVAAALGEDEIAAAQAEKNKRATERRQAEHEKRSATNQAAIKRLDKKIAELAAEEQRAQEALNRLTPFSSNREQAAAKRKLSEARRRRKSAENTRVKQQGRRRK